MELPTLRRPSNGVGSMKEDYEEYRQHCENVARIIAPHDISIERKLKIYFDVCSIPTKTGRD